MRTLWRLGSRQTRILALLLLAFALAGGCVTQRQVRDIVAESNAEMLTVQLDADAGSLVLPTPEGSTNTVPAWQRASDRIEAFIAAHPDQAKANAALRIRQAMLLLANGQLNLARAAFNAADPGQLHTQRDLALHRIRETLVWWFGASTNAFTAADFKEADRALTDLQTVQSTLTEAPDVRDYVAELRAWIGLRAARASTSKERSLRYWEDALNTYATIFAASDLAALGGGMPSTGETELTTDLRRRLRAQAVLDYAKDIRQRNQLQPQLTSQVFEQVTSGQ